MDYSYDMEELADYYRQYHRLMQHWEQVLPGKVLTVHYEDTVLDLETQVRRILDALRACRSRTPACISTHENPRTVRTASSEQVRRPIYTEALGTWRRYDKHLGYLEDRAGRHHRGPAGASTECGAQSGLSRDRAAGRGSVVGPHLEAVNGVADVARQVYRQQHLVALEVIDRDRGRRGSAGDHCIRSARTGRARIPAGQCRWYRPREMSASSIVSRHLHHAVLAIVTPGIAQRARLVYR